MKKLSYILSFFIILSLNSCEKKCKEYDEFPMFEIIEGINGTKEIEIPIHFNGMSDSYIVRNDSIYQHLINKTLEDSCVSCVFPTIDFEKYDLIGKQTDTFNALKKVIASDNDYIYILKVVKNSTTILIAATSMNWLLIPKTQETDMITFKIYYYGCK